jgi:hypothetical protein
MFLMAIKRAGLGITAIAVVQSIISILASLSIYSCAKQLSQSVATGLLAALFFILWLKISQWNMYILCESLYISCTAITVYLFQIQNRSWKIELVSILAMILTFFIKPTGLVVLLAGISYYIFRFVKGKSRRTIVIAVSILILGLLANTMLVTFQMVETYATGDIVYGCSWGPSQACPKVLTLEATNLTFPNSSEPVVNVFLFHLYNPWFSLKLSFAKLIAFLVHAKPYYSNIHNIFALTTLLPAYYLCIKGIKHAKSDYQVFTITHLVASCLTVMLTVEDWDGRFLMPLLPLIFIFTAVGIQHKLHTHDTRNSPQASNRDS